MDQQIVQRCRDYLGPAGEGSTDEEVVKACEGTLWLATLRLNLALKDMFSPLLNPLQRLLMLRRDPPRKSS